MLTGRQRKKKIQEKEKKWNTKSNVIRLPVETEMFISDSRARNALAADGRTEL